MTTLTTRFAQISWDEHDLATLESGAKIATVEAHMRFTGDIEAETSTQGFILAYDAQGMGTFSGYEVLSGTVSGKAGGFILATVGSFTPNGIEARWAIVDGSGTGELEGITGTGSYLLPWGSQETDATLEVSLPGS
jgi:hypothetical protein